MRLFSVLYVIVLSVVCLTTATLLVSKCEHDTVLLVTLSTRSYKRRSNFCCCYCRVIRQCKNSTFSFGQFMETERGELHRSPLWVVKLLDS